MIAVLSGGSGCGKTVVCRRVVALARKRDLHVAGVITLPRMAGGEKVALEVWDLRRDRRRPLARREDPADGPSTGRWHFYDAGLAWGATALRQATPCDLLIIDELGPLELVQGEGWTAGLEVLAGGGYGLALVVVRPALIEQFRAAMAGAEIDLLPVNPASRDALPERIVRRLLLMRRQRDERFQLYAQGVDKDTPLRKKDD